MTMVQKLQAAVVSSVSEETKVMVDTNSLILSYLHHFRNVNKYLDTDNLQHSKPCK